MSISFLYHSKKRSRSGHAERIHILICLFIFVTLSGCETLHYYGQAVSGQMKILTGRKSIDRLLSAPETPQTLKTQLKLVLDIREFAKEALHLPVSNHYLSYIDLKRPYAVWNVFAAPEFSLEPKTWYYPVIGRTAYRGYFSKQTAIRYADGLKKKYFDVYVAGVAAYSTLGWFDDSVLNTVIHRTDTGLAALIFHELAHQVLYIKNDTAFNESFATAVEQEGLRRWMHATQNPPAYQDYLLQRRRREQFIQLITRFRSQLEALYSQTLLSDEKRSLKKDIYNQLRFEYAQMKQAWQGYTGYDYWFKEPLNNAKLISVSTYYDYLPAFINILKQSDGDLEQFYGRCKKLAGLSKSERNRRLKNYFN
jgi:predicted aminopeptidase